MTISQANMQFHIYISNVSLFENIVVLGTATDGHLNLVPPGVPRHLRDESVLVVHQLPHFGTHGACGAILRENPLPGGARHQQWRFHPVPWSKWFNMLVVSSSRAHGLPLGALLSGQAIGSIDSDAGCSSPTIRSYEGYGHDFNPLKCASQSTHWGVCIDGCPTDDWSQVDATGNFVIRQAG